MRGSDSRRKEHQEGLIPLSVKEIYNIIKNDQERTYNVSVSYLEVSKFVKLKKVLILTVRFIMSVLTT